MKHINIDLDDKLLIQKERYIGPEQAMAGTAEVHKLLEVGFIREC